MAKRLFKPEFRNLSYVMVNRVPTSRDKMEADSDKYIKMGFGHYFSNEVVSEDSGGDMLSQQSKRIEELEAENKKLTADNKKLKSLVDKMKSTEKKPRRTRKKASDSKEEIAK